ncbi:MAG: hypothetical protein HEP71_13070 [Roseivirga sp.]|nr:hypothetical protein [Roseivirga sp.]
MKIKSVKFIMSMILAVTVVYSCADQPDEQPVSVQESLTRIITHSSDMTLGEHTFKREVTMQVNLNQQGEIETVDVLSRTLDGVEMEKVGDGKWTVSAVVSVGEGSGNGSSPVSGTAGVEYEECETERTLISFVPNPLAPQASLCIYDTVTTCFETGFDSQGVLTTIFTMDEGIEFGVCSLL